MPKKKVEEEAKTLFNVGDNVRLKKKKNKKFTIYRIKKCDDGTFWYDVSDDENNTMYLLASEIELDE